IICESAVDSWSVREKALDTVMRLTPTRSAIVCSVTRPITYSGSRPCIQRRSLPTPLPTLGRYGIGQLVQRACDRAPSVLGRRRPLGPGRLGDDRRVGQ